MSVSSRTPHERDRLWLCLYLPQAPGPDAFPGLAAWALRFSPLVNVDPGGALLLEIAASLELFGGAEALRAAAVSGMSERGHAVTTAIAPTARAALWLARAGEATPVTEPALLPGMLARLPVDLPGWPHPVPETLRRMGVRQLGDCMRLPRDGLARRIGDLPLKEIDEALGRRAELRQGWRPVTRFCDELDLPAETEENALLIEALRILFQRLEIHLRSRQAGAQILWVHLRHRVAPDTLLRIGLLEPRADAAHLEELATIHLSALSIPAPVIAVLLAADAAEAAPAIREDLLGCRLDLGERMAGLVEKLQLRLGRHAVHGIRPAREHRPERAWEAVQEAACVRRASGDGAMRGARRPLWILERPAPLGKASGMPCFHGPLTFESGPERVETGWWDGHDAERDYYVARNAAGARVWIFRDRRRGGSWHLHGLFG